MKLAVASDSWGSSKSSLRMDLRVADSFDSVANSATSVAHPFDLGNDTASETMEGTDVRFGELARKPIRYLGYRLAVERQHQDVVRGHALVANEVSDLSQR